MQHLKINAHDKNQPIIALYKPQIPPNTGNIARLCVAINAPLWIIGKPSFNIDDASVKRAGLDYWNHLQFQHFKSFKKFYSSYKSQNFRVILVTKIGKVNYWDWEYKPNDIFIFGNEQHGLPPKFLKVFKNHISIPMLGNVRSLNLSNAVSIISYECLRQYYKNNQHLLEREIQNVNRSYYKNGFTSSQNHKHKE